MEPEAVTNAHAHDTLAMRKVEGAPEPKSVMKQRLLRSMDR